MTTPLEAWAVAALQSLPVFHEDVGAPEKPAQLAMVAQAVTEAAREQKSWPLSKQTLMAAALTIFKHESSGSLRIHRNECNLKKRECDMGKAISSFQLHASALSSPDLWPKLGFMTLESTKLSAKEAARVFVRMYRYCAATGLPDDRVAMAFVGYAGRGCRLDGKWQGWQVRMGTYRQLLRVPVPKAAASSEAQKPAG